MNQCQHENCKDITEGVYCQDCEYLIDTPIFDNWAYEKMSPNMTRPMRYSKFKQVLDTCNLEWDKYQTLMDLFDRVDLAFRDSPRKNFVSINQLIIIMGKRLGIDINLPSLKTQSRINIIESLVNSAMQPTHPNPLPHLRDLEYIAPKGLDDESWRNKVVKGQIYTDL